MNDIIDNIVTINQIGQKITPEESAALELKLNGLLNAIRCSRSFEDAGSYFDILAQFQTDLARACFKWNMELPPPLRQLVREFDHSDDLDLRLAIFKRIKDGNFLI